MKSWRRRLLLSFGVTAAIAGGLAFAAGAPKTQVLWYSGYLENMGAPVTVMTGVAVALYLPDGGGSSCVFDAGVVTPEKGRFRIQLPDTCVAPIRTNPDLWVELSVNGTALPRSKLGAVPYAVEATSAENGVPTGTLVPFAGSVVPPGWLLCDGSSVPVVSYPALFAVIGATYGASDGGTFPLPNLQGRLPIGQKTDAGIPDAGNPALAVLGALGGSELHTLLAGELPAHTHKYYGGDFSVGGGGGAKAVNDLTTTPGANTGPGPGTSAPFNQLPPFVVVNYIIKN